MSQKKTYTFYVNAFEIQAQYYEEDIKTLFIPLLKKLTEMQKQKKQRLLVYLAASPGVGKTTLSLFLEHLSKMIPELTAVQAIGLDGFHFPQAYLQQHSIEKEGKQIMLADIKGAAETFDLEKIHQKIRLLKVQDISWPVYDRSIHDVVADQIAVTGDIVLLEGNWLLLGEPGWNQLAEECDYSIFVRADQNMLKERLIERKMKGGFSRTEASAWYDKSDGVNVVRVLENSLPADLELKLEADGKYQKEEGYKR